MLATMMQLRPAQGFISVDFTLAANTPAVPPAGLPLTDATFGILTGAPANSDYAVEQIIIYHDSASTATLRVGHATSARMPILAGQYFPIVAGLISQVYLANTSANVASGSIFLFLSEPY